MKTVKDDNLSFITQVFLFRGSARLSVGVIAGFTLEEKPELLPEPDFLGLIKDGLGKDIIFDPGMPKPFGEALLAGKCFAPGGKPVPAMLPSLRVGPVRKRLAVFGNRRWKQMGGMRTVISEPEPFTEMTMTWKRAFGGPKYEANPDGVGMTGDLAPLANIELPDRLIGAPGDRPAPAGFEPLGMVWPGRLKGRGTFDDAWVRNTWPAYPDDYNFLYFNRAPADQRIEGWFYGDEPVEADHLHPERAYIRSRLPGVRARCFVVRVENGEELFVEIEMRLETVWLLPNLLTGVLIWRGVTVVSDDEASNTPLLSAFTEPLDARPESLEFYLARVRAMQAGDAPVAAAETPPAEKSGAVDLPDIKAPGVPGIGVSMASAAGVAGYAISALAEEETGAPEAGSASVVSAASSAAPEAGAIPEAPPAEEGPQPLVVRSAEDIPKIEIPEFPPLEDLIGPTAFEKKTEALVREILQAPPDQPISPEPGPFPDMTPQELQSHMEAMSAQAEAEARRFFAQHGFDPDAPVEIPPPPPELERWLQVDPIPENIPVGQIPLLLQEQSRIFQERFEDLANKHHIDPYALHPDEEKLPFSNAAELEQSLKHSGYDNPDFFEELRKIDVLQNEADSRMDQYLAILGTSRAALAANAEKGAEALRAEESVKEAELQEFIRQLASGAVPGMAGGAPLTIPEEPSPVEAEGEAPSEEDEDDLDEDLPGEEAAPPPEPPAREEVLKSLEEGGVLAGANLAGADLSEANLSNRDFQGTDFSDANLEKADFTNSLLTGANLTGAILTGAIFTGAALAKALLSTVSASGANFDGVDLSRSDLSHGDFTVSDFTGADLTGARMERAMFNEAKMAGISLARASAPRAEFMGADLTGATLAGIDCTEADFSAAVIEKADFTGATAVSSLFSKARGTGAVFREANLFNSRADQPADLRGADFTNANFKDARWQDTDFSEARFPGADLTNGLFTRCRFEAADLTGVNAPNADFQKSVFIRARASKINLFKGSLRKSDLAETDFSGSNLYGVDFFQANVVRTRFDGAVLDGTLIAEWRPS